MTSTLIHTYYLHIIIGYQFHLLPSTGREREDIVAKLEEESKKIVFEFIALVSSTERALIRDKVTVQSLILVIENLHSLLKRDNNELINKLTSLKNKNISEAMQIMSQYWSFFDHEILSAIIKSCQEINSELKTKHDAYMTEFNKYCKRSLCEIPLEALRSDKLGDEKAYLKSVIYIKLDEVFTVPANDIKKVLKKISRILDTSLCLVRFEEGCVELKCVSMHELFPLNDKQIDDLMQSKNILRIYNEKQDLYNAGTFGAKNK